MLQKFFLVSISTYISWEIIYNFFIYDSKFDLWTIIHSVESSYLLLKILNVQTEVVLNEISIIGEKGVLINSDCNIFRLFGFYISFVFAYPNRLKIKLTYVAFGFILLFLTNVIRISSFVIVIAYLPDICEVFQKYSNFLFFDRVVFSLWFIIIKKS